MSSDIYPIAPEALIECLDGLGIPAGTSLFTHTAFRQLYRGSVKAAPPQASRQYARDLIRALRGHVGADGVLMMPTEYAGDYQLDAFRKTRFDLRTAPTNRGFLCSAFLETDGVRRSSGPIYNVTASGPRDFLATLDAHHSLAYSMDKGSPWWEFMRRGGKIAYIGASLDSNSFIHMPEYVLKQDYPRPVFFGRPHTFYLTDTTGRNLDVEAYVHAIRWGPLVVTKFCRFLNHKYGILREGRIENTPVIVVDAKAQYDALMAELELGMSWYDAMTWGEAT
ncbi:MAG TPA: AAC(3) family N-acetyltransferase [Caulobacterales bacterium]|jgi:aminoglycoside N3'-acetyltransferase|nr:AAC(3) family N-acetyltransferase [Caulobacterales bacterium]